MLLDLWLGGECEGAIPMLFLAYPRDDVDVCFVTAERKRPLVCRQRKDTRQSLTPLLLCQVPTRLRTSAGLGLTRYAKHPVPPPRPRDDNIRRRVDPNTQWLFTPPTNLFVSLQPPASLFPAYEKKSQIPQ